MKVCFKISVAMILIIIVSGCVSGTKRVPVSRPETPGTGTDNASNASLYEAILQAHYLSFSGKVPEAMTIFNDLLEKFQENSDLTFQYAKFFLDLTFRTQDRETSLEMLDRAKKALLKTIDLDPLHTDAQKLLANIHVDSGEFSSAISILENLVRRYPEDIALQIDLARLYIHTREPEKAIDGLGPMVDGNAVTNYEVLKVYALAFAESNRLQDAISLYRRYLDVYPGEFEAMYNLALCYFRSDRYEDAEQTLRSIHETRGLSVDVAELYTDVLKARGKFDEAVSLLKTIAKDPRFEVGALIEIGQIYLSLEKPETAENYFKQAVSKAPNDRRATFFTAVALQSQGQCVEALRILENNLEDKPVSMMSAELAIHCLLQLDNHDESLRICDRLLTERSHDARSYLICADVLEQLERHEKAISVLQTGAEIFPENPDIHLFLAFKLEQQDDWQEAVTIAEQVLQAVPEDSDAANFIGYVLADRNRELDRALTLIRQALARQPDNAAYLDSLGWVLFRMGKLNEALQNVKKAAEQLPDDPSIIEHLIHIYVALGDIDTASDLLDKALIRFPQNKGIINAGSLFTSKSDE
jgi:tetratricopeptide (TPR) repeat protein